MRNWIKKLLGIDVLESKIKEQSEEIEKLKRENFRNQKWLKDNTQEINTLLSTINVGVDIHQKSSSWCVISIRGKRDYVEFFSLGESSIREISSFLSKFRKSNLNIDTPHVVPKEFFFDKLK